MDQLNNYLRRVRAGLRASVGGPQSRLILAVLAGCAIASQADTITNAMANLLAINTKLGPPSQAGASNANLEIASGGTGFSQGGVIFSHGGWGTDYDGLFDNFGAAGGTFPNFPSTTDYLALYDYMAGGDRIDSLNGSGGPLLFQSANIGYVGIGGTKATPQLLSVGGSGAYFDPTSLASESLTNGALTGGTSWTATNDCSLVSNAATCTFSAGTASTIQQASGTLAIAGIANRMYKFVYTISAAAGNPTAALTGAFFNTTSAAPINLLLTNGTHTQYFQAVMSPGNFVITTTLTTGQTFTIDTLSLKEITGGSLYLGGVNDAAGYSVKGVAGFSGTSGTSCTPTTIKSGIVTAANCI